MCIRDSPWGICTNENTYPKGYAQVMQLPEDATEPVIKRLKRAHGQIAGIIRMLEDGRECEDVVTQLAAVAKAIDRAGFTLVSAGMKECLAHGEDVDVAKMEKMFLSLA